MLEKLLELDSKLFVFLNGLGSETYDGLWLLITRQVNWIPLFLLLLFLIYRKFGLKQTVVLVLFAAVLITFSDQMTNVFKRGFERLRPGNNPNINLLIRAVQKRDSFSFFSGHASNTMAVATFLFLIMKRYYNYFWFLFLWPLIFAYSRIYLGLHYPSDIIAGYIFGAICGFLMFKVYQAVQHKYFLSENILQDSADGESVANGE